MGARFASVLTTHAAVCAQLHRGLREDEQRGACSPCPNPATRSCSPTRIETLPHVASATRSFASESDPRVLDVGVVAPQLHDES